MIRRVETALEERTGSASFMRAALRYVFQPCRVAGNAYATWVAFAVPFRL